MAMVGDRLGWSASGMYLILKRAGITARDTREGVRASEI